MNEHQKIIKNAFLPIKINNIIFVFLSYIGISLYKKMFSFLRTNRKKPLFSLLKSTW